MSRKPTFTQMGKLRHTKVMLNFMFHKCQSQDPNSQFTSESMSLVTMPTASHREQPLRDKLCQVLLILLLDAAHCSPCRKPSCLRWLQPTTPYLITIPGMGCASPMCTPEKHLLYGIITAIQLLVSPSRFGVLGATE